MIENVLYVSSQVAYVYRGNTRPTVAQKYCIKGAISGVCKVVTELTVWHHIQVVLGYVERLNSVESLCQNNLKIQPSPVALQLFKRLLSFKGIPCSL